MLLICAALGVSDIVQLECVASRGVQGAGSVPDGQVERDVRIATRHIGQFLRIGAAAPVYGTVQYETITDRDNHSSVCLLSDDQVQGQGTVAVGVGLKVLDVGPAAGICLAVQHVLIADIGADAGCPAVIDGQVQGHCRVATQVVLERVVINA